MVDAMIGQEALHVEKVSVKPSRSADCCSPRRMGMPAAVRHFDPQCYPGTHQVHRNREGLDALEEFNPERMASRILAWGMYWG